MLAQRVACQTPWGEVHDLVVVESRVVVPGELADMRSLCWLGDEHHPRLAVTALSVLERATGAALGLAPYCVTAERWNQAARENPWLPEVRLGRHSTATAIDAAELEVAAGPLRLPKRATRPREAARGADQLGSAVLNRLQNGGDAVGSLFDVVRMPLRLVLQLAGVAAGAYYLLAAAAWLWALRNGMEGAEVQSGVVVLLVGLLLSGITRALWDRPLSDVVDARAVRRVPPIVDTTLGAYRLGISLQVLAFAAFAVL